MPRLLRLTAAKEALIRPVPRIARRSSPRPGRSSLITSAPRSPSNAAQYGPAMTRDRSRTRIPFSMATHGAAALVGSQGCSHGHRKSAILPERREAR